MMIFIIGFLTVMGLIPIIIKLDKAERELWTLTDREHEKNIKGIARYNEMKNGV